MRRSLTSCALTGVVALALAPVIASAQNRNFTSPKNSLGQPDITGIWTNATVTPLERPVAFGDRLVMTEAEVAERERAEAEYRAAGDTPTDPSLTVEDLPNDSRGFTGTNIGYNRGWTDPGMAVMRVGGEPRTSFITFPENGRVPPARNAGAGRGGALAAVAGRAGRGGRGTDNPETMSLGERCLTSFGSSAGPIMLPLLYNNTYEIVQGRDSVAILVEMVHDVRIVRLNAEHRTDGVRPWWGDSVGRYEGDTLVVSTTNYHPRNTLRGASADLKVEERFTRVAPDRLLYQFKVEAPSVWDQPWGGEYEFGPSNAIFEYACHEGNYGMENMLAGARAEDAQRAEAAAAGN